MPFSCRLYFVTSNRRRLTRQRASHERGWGRCGVAACAAVAFFFLISTSAVADPGSEFEFELGHWVGTSEWSETGRFESCMISEHNEADELLILRLDRVNALTIGVFEKKWQDAKLARIPVFVLADHNVLFFGTGLLFRNDMLVVGIEDADPALAKMVQSKLLGVSVRDQMARFALTDSDQAISYLKACVADAVPPVPTG